MSAVMESEFIRSQRVTECPWQQYHLPLMWPVARACYHVHCVLPSFASRALGTWSTMMRDKMAQISLAAQLLTVQSLHGFV